MCRRRTWTRSRCGTLATSRSRRSRPPREESIDGTTESTTRGVHHGTTERRRGTSMSRMDLAMKQRSTEARQYDGSRGARRSGRRASTGSEMRSWPRRSPWLRTSAEKAAQPHRSSLAGGAGVRSPLATTSSSGVVAAWPEHRRPPSPLVRAVCSAVTRTRHGGGSGLAQENGRFGRSILTVTRLSLYGWPALTRLQATSR